MGHKFDPLNAELLDSPDRIRFLNPDNILDRVGLNSETILADLGCGTGYFTIPASRRVKKVFALDVQQEMLDILDDRVRKEKIANIEIVLSGESSIPLPDNSVHVLLLANVFHELDDREAMLKEGKRVLISTGKLVIIDWKKMHMDFGPPFGERLRPDEVISICKDNGFELKEESEGKKENYSS